MCQSLFLGDITPGILLLNKRQGRASGTGKAVLAEGAWPSNLKWYSFFCALVSPGFSASWGSCRLRPQIWSGARLLGGILNGQIPSATAINLLPQSPTDLSDFKREDEGRPLSCGDRVQRTAVLKPNWQESDQMQGASQHYVPENKAGHSQRLERMLVFNTGLGETEACIHTKTYTEEL